MVSEKFSSYEQFRLSLVNPDSVLIRYDVDGERDKTIAIVLSQYKKSRDLGFTLSCYCTAPFQLTKSGMDLPVQQRITSEWTQLTSGGPPGNKAFSRNPMWSFQVPEGGVSIQLRCTTQKSCAANIMIVATHRPGQRILRLNQEPIVDSGNYRHAFVVTEPSRLPMGHYTIIASIFDEGKTGTFFLDILSSARIQLRPVAEA